MSLRLLLRSSLDSKMHCMANRLQAYLGKRGHYLAMVLGPRRPSSVPTY
jgi:hypothetical protein